MKSIKTKHIKIKKEKLFIKYKDSARLQCVNGFLMIFKNILYVLKLEINLILVKKFY